MDDDQKIASNKKVTRNKLLSTLSQFGPTTVVMKACYTSHPWGRAIQALGHTVKLMPPYQVKPFVAGKKTTTTMPSPLQRLYTDPGRALFQ